MTDSSLPQAPEPAYLPQVTTADAPVQPVSLAKPASPGQSLVPVQPVSPVYLVPVQAVAPGWYPDARTGRQRWWDGIRWTENYAPIPLQRALKDTTITYVLLILLGGLGIYQFYLGRTGLGILMLLLTIIGSALTIFVIGIPIVAAVWIWLIVDLFLVPSYVRAANAAIV